DTVRQHFGAEHVDVIGHSYVALTSVLYAIRYGPRLRRLILIGPMPPRQTPYPAHLSNHDATLRETFANLAQLQTERASLDPEAFCRKAWSVLRVIYVADPTDAHRIGWGRCDLPNERGFMKYWLGTILPSIQAIDWTTERVDSALAPVLVIHGTMDRS